MGSKQSLRGRFRYQKLKFSLCCLRKGLPKFFQVLNVFPIQHRSTILTPAKLFIQFAGRARVPGTPENG